MPQSQNIPNTIDLTRPGVIEASAGTGKTYTLAKIYIALLCGKKNYSTSSDSRINVEECDTSKLPSVKEILVVTFTEAATAELKERLQKEIREGIKSVKEEIDKRKEQGENIDPDSKIYKIYNALRVANSEFDSAPIATIHGFCNRILKDFSYECGLLEMDDIIENNDVELLQFVQKWQEKELLMGNEGVLAITPDEIKNIINEFLKFGNDLEIVSPEDKYEEQLEISKTGFETVSLEYENRLLEIIKKIQNEALPEWKHLRENAISISYDEILSRTFSALKREDFVRKISARYKAALVDEFQDTDPTQWGIFNKIFVEKEKPFFCIGDPKQAIYSFRGGDIYTYRTATAEIKRNGNILSLSKNYRSTENFITALNTLFSVEFKDEEKPFDYVPVEYPKETSEGEKKTSIFIKEWFSKSKDAGKPKILRQVVKDVETLIDCGVPPGEIAILCLDNNTIKEYIDEFKRINFRRRGVSKKKPIPVSAVSNKSVYSTEEAQELFFIMQAVLYLERSKDFVNAVSCSLLREKYFGAVTAQEDAVIFELKQYFIQARKRWQKQGFFCSFFELFKNLGIWETLQRADNTRTIVNLKHIFELLNVEENRFSLGMDRLCGKLKQRIQATKNKSVGTDDAFRVDTDLDAIKITTVHKSKGLEYRFVFLPDLWNRSLSSKNTSGFDFIREKNDDGTNKIYFKCLDKKKFSEASRRKNRQDQACTFYVAVTRAKSQVFLYHLNILKKSKSKEKTEKKNEYENFSSEILDNLLENTEREMLENDKSKLISVLTRLAKDGIVVTSEYCPPPVELEDGPHSFPKSFFSEISEEFKEKQEDSFPENDEDENDTVANVDFGHWGIFSYSGLTSAVHGNHADDPEQIYDEPIYEYLDTEFEDDGKTRELLSRKVSKSPFPNYPMEDQFGNANYKTFEGVDYEKAFWELGTDGECPELEKLLDLVDKTFDREVENPSAAHGNNSNDSEQIYDEPTDEYLDAESWTTGNEDNEQKEATRKFPKQPFFDLPMGAQFGNVVHEIFEKIDYEQAFLDLKKGKESPELKQLLDLKFQDPEERKKISKLVQACLSVPVSPQNLLCQIPKKDSLREMEFFFPVKNTKKFYAELSRLFKSWGGLYGEIAERHFGEELPIEGLMKGSIDLVYRSNEKYYIADWKTNRVKDAKSLSEEDFEDEIIKNAYALQWMIYSVALRRHLQNSFGSQYNHQTHFGGVRYIFVRWAKSFEVPPLSEEMLNQFEAILTKF